MIAKHCTTSAVLAALAVFLSTPVAADTMLEFRSHAVGDSTPQASAVSVYVSDAFVRINESARTWMLYDHGADTLFVVDEENREYTPLDRSAIAALGKEMAAARAEVERQIAKMSPEQRAMVEEMVGHSLDKKPAQLTFQSTGERKTVNGYDCTVGKLTDGGQTHEEFCTAQPRAIGMPGEEFRTVRDMYALMSELQQASGFTGGVPGYDQLDGLPIEIKSRDGAVQVISRVSHGDIEEQMFRLPEGYKQVLPAGSGSSNEGAAGQVKSIN